jgi:prophage regulatory protein
LESGLGAIDRCFGLHINSLSPHHSRPGKVHFRGVVVNASLERKPVRFLRLPEVRRITGLSKSSLYVRINEGRFPHPVKLGGRAVGWIEDDVTQWAMDCIAESRPICGQPDPAAVAGTSAAVRASALPTPEPTSRQGNLPSPASSSCVAPGTSPSCKHP